MIGATENGTGAVNSISVDVDSGGMVKVMNEHVSVDQGQGRVNPTKSQMQVNYAAMTNAAMTNAAMTNEGRMLQDGTMIWSRGPFEQLGDLPKNN
ncbi:MAG: hypothetical protein K9H25_08410 [Rhodospirillum sp.]|nr:hypothetical protein [Rhodospirillum sp.]MCF8492109.1 hypothetical protein [Rhodospirillum sp.]MCF8501157.1 hypothetical protein [Rhodospirillum sp.]